MKIFKLFTLVFLVLPYLAFICEGCLDAPVSPYGALSGKIYDRNGFPEYDLEISSGHYPYIYTGITGGFSFNYEIKPFNMIIGSYDNFYNYYPHWAVKYLSINSNFVNLFDFRYTSFPHNLTSLNVTFPPLDSNKLVFLKFISNEQVLQNTYITGYPHDSAFFSLVYFTDGESQISGQLIYLEVTPGSSGNLISSYDKFGTKNIVLNSGEPKLINFTNYDLNYKPQTSYVNFTVVTQGNSSSSYMHSYLNFIGMSQGSEIPLESLGNTHSGIFNMPILPQLNCKLRISSSGNGEKWVFANGGENVTIARDNPLILAMPTNQQTGITDTSNFIISDNGEKGVYCFNFETGIGEHPNQSFLITDKKQIKFSDVKTEYDIFSPGKLYVWSVSKYAKYNSIDDFVSVKYLDDNNYTSTYTTPYRLFTTAP